MLPAVFIGSVALAEDSQSDSIFTGGTRGSDPAIVVETLFGRNCSLAIHVSQNLKVKKITRQAKKILVSRGYNVLEDDKPVSEAEFTFIVIYESFNLNAKSGGKVVASLTHAEAPTPDKVVPFYREQKTPGGALDWFSKRRVNDLIVEVPQCVVVPPGTTPPSQTGGGVVIGKDPIPDGSTFPTDRPTDRNE